MAKEAIEIHARREDFQKQLTHEQLYCIRMLRLKSPIPEKTDASQPGKLMADDPAELDPPLQLLNDPHSA